MAQIEQEVADDKRLFILQKYIDKPYLVDNLKFDMRVYVLVYGTDPMRVFLFNDGLARFATVPYSSPNDDNFSDQYMHLTNYSIQKEAENFEANTCIDEDLQGHKRSA